MDPNAHRITIAAILVHIATVKVTDNANNLRPEVDFARIQAPIVAIIL
jgi:hypothetical protein